MLFFFERNEGSAVADVDVKTDQVRGLYSHCFPILELLIYAITSKSTLFMWQKYIYCLKDLPLHVFSRFFFESDAYSRKVHSNDSRCL